MKICDFSDVHWCTNTSLVRSRGELFSTRLEYLIKSMNFVNKIAVDKNCKIMVCNGDFFDKSKASDEELTAIKQIMWNELPCYFICGNHESSVSDLRFSSLKALETDNHKIIDRPEFIELDGKLTLFLPYIVESSRKNLSEYLDNKHPDIIFSHNDIQGINYGGFESKTGFNIKEIEDNCNIYLNGHLHNSEWITNKILNVGSFSAHNFTNDSFRYKYGIWIFDTDTLELEFIENPYSLNFYKINISKEQDLTQLNTIKNNAVLAVSCNNELFEKCQQVIDSYSSVILEKRITLTYDTVEAASINVNQDDLRMDNCIQKFITFCNEKLERTEILNAELAELSK